MPDERKEPTLGPQETGSAASEQVRESPDLPPLRETRRKKEKPERKGWKYTLIDLLSVVVAAVVIAAVLKMFVVDSRLVPSGSMEPTIMTNDRVILLKFSYYFSEPQRGDVVVFTTNEEFDGDEDLLKRVIGEPGDTVEVRDYQVFINGAPLDEPYLAEAPVYTYAPVTVPDDHYFMLGDNRNRSKDSHAWEDPFVSRDEIKGRVVLRYWPLSHFGVVE